MVAPIDPNDLVTLDDHTPDHWPLALSLWGWPFQQQLAQLKARNGALLTEWLEEDAARQRDAIELDLNNSYGQFNVLRHSRSGVVH